MDNLKIDFEKMGGLVPAIVQDAQTLRVLMLGFMNPEAYSVTVESKHVTFYSRTRQTLWTKGETSGHFLDLVSMSLDCDNDTLLVKANPHGGVCHTGADTCWNETNRPSDNKIAVAQKSYEEDCKKEGTIAHKIHSKGLNKVAQEMGESSMETIIAAAGGDKEKLKKSAASLLYNIGALLYECGMSIDEIGDYLPND